MNPHTFCIYAAHFLGSLRFPMLSSRRLDFCRKRIWCLCVQLILLHILRVFGPQMMSIIHFIGWYEGQNCPLQLDVLHSNCIGPLSIFSTIFGSYFVIFMLVVYPVYLGFFPDEWAVCQLLSCPTLISTKVFMDVSTLVLLVTVASFTYMYKFPYIILFGCICFLV